MGKRATTELLFRSLVRSLTTTEVSELLERMRQAMGQPDPQRVWCVVRVDGGCDGRTSGEVDGD